MLQSAIVGNRNEHAVTRRFRERGLVRWLIVLLPLGWVAAGALIDGSPGGGSAPIIEMFAKE